MAAGLAAEIQEATGVEPKLIEERSGVLDIFVDDAMIYSLSEAGRFPRPGEIAAIFKQ